MTKTTFNALIARYISSIGEFEALDVHMAFHTKRKNMFIFRGKKNKPGGCLWVLTGFKPIPLADMTFLTPSEVESLIPTHVKDELFYEIIVVPDKKIIRRL